MTITLPLSLADFADKIEIASLKARLGYQQEFSGMGSGSILAANIGPTLKEFDVTCTPKYHEDANEILAMIEALDGSINAFYLYDPRNVAPQADPTGSILGSNIPELYALNADNKRIRLSGLPVGYKITAGDRMSWDFGGTHRAYHRALETVVADNSGITPYFEIRDYLRPGSVTGTDVTLIKPAMMCKMIDGTLDDAADDQFTNISFSVRQVK